MTRLAKTLALAAALGGSGATHVPAPRSVCVDTDSCSRTLTHTRTAARTRSAAFDALIGGIGETLLTARREYEARSGASDRATLGQTQSLPPRRRWGTGNSTDAQYCPHQSYWELVPAFDARVKPSAPSVTWPGDGCFQSMSASATFTATGASITVTGSSATSFLCSDAYIIGTWYSFAVVEVGQLNPTATVQLNYTSASEAQNARDTGVNIFVLPCGIIGSVNSLIATAGLFFGDTDWEVQYRNYDFLVGRGVWPAAATFNQSVTVDKSIIKSGTYLAIGRMDGLDPAIMFGTGGTTGHSALAVWEGDTLYVSESTDAASFLKAYWPPPYGIIRHDFDTWVSLAHAANFHVALLPPAPDVAAAFNETAFWNWFYTVQGMPYGYHTMLFSFMDTSDPLMNMPEPFTTDSLTLVLNYMDKLLPNSSYDISGYSMLTWGLNKRLNASCGTLSCILDILVANRAAGRPIQDFSAAMAIPEKDGVKYGANYSMVCSQYAAHGLKAGLAGAFPVWNSIQAAEQTPKDNYQLAIYDPAFYNDQNCPGGVRTAAGAQGTYCQILGPWELYLPGYNSIPLYAHMDESCPSQWPSYQRCPAGNDLCC